MADSGLAWLVLDDMDWQIPARSWGRRIIPIVVDVDAIAHVVELRRFFEDPLLSVWITAEAGEHRLQAFEGH